MSGVYLQCMYVHDICMYVCMYVLYVLINKLASSLVRSTT